MRRTVVQWCRGAHSSAGHEHHSLSALKRPALAESPAPFDFSRYHCVGFDLDHTLCQYRLPQLLHMIYTRCLTPFLVDRLGPAAAPVLGRWDQDRRLCTRGLVLDSALGNLLRLSAGGRVQCALHGTHWLPPAALHRLYATDTSLASLMATLCDSPCGRFRVLRDFFDVPVALATSRLVHGVDEHHLPGVTYAAIGDSLRAALVHMYHRDQFGRDNGGFFSILRQDTDQYASVSSQRVVDGLASLRQSGKLVFLVTSSHIDYASHMARLALGHQWHRHFDLIVTFARKPLFFRSHLPFLELANDGREAQPVAAEQLCLGQAYSQGNWHGLQTALARLCQHRSPKCVYVGDNMAFDILPVLRHTSADCIALYEELDWEQESDQLWRPAPLDPHQQQLQQPDEPCVWSSLMMRATHCASHVDHLF